MLLDFAGPHTSRDKITFCRMLHIFARLILSPMRRCGSYSLGAREGRGGTFVGPTFPMALEMFIYSSSHLFKI